MEIDSLRFMPPDKVPTRLCLWGYMPVSFKILTGANKKGFSMESQKHTYFFMQYNQPSDLKFDYFH